jgi:phosphotriesterase-related protein
MDVYNNAFSRRNFLNRSSLSFAAVLTSSIPFSALLGNQSIAKRKRSIPTLTGSIEATRLGTTLMHEHILWFAGPMEENAGYTPIPEALVDTSVDYAVGLLNDASRVGIDTIVDLTPFRPIDLYQRIASRTKVNIIASTGFYRRSKVPKWMADMEDESQMEAIMLKEVSQGIDNTNIRAGIIKIAGEGFTDWQKKIFRAAAKVNKATGTPIATHSGSDAAEQFRFLTDAGANPHHILLSHVDVGRKGKPGDLLELARQGAYLEVDTFGQDFYTPWEELVAFLRAFCDAGLAGKVIISIDSNWHWEDGKKVFEGGGPPNFDPNADHRNFSYMITDAVPALLKSGFSMQEINTFLIENPRNYFTAVK